jgi:8-oxo-dGTP diphosphatase
MKKQFTYDYVMASPTADVVLFGMDFMAPPGKQLKVLLIKRADPKEVEFDKWALPGGFLNCADEKSLDYCAIRELREETRVELPFSYLEQLYTYSNLGRDPREQMGTPKRIITTAYLGITNTLNLGERADGLESSQVGWKGLDEVSYAFDHNVIVANAVERLRKKIRWTNVAFKFLPEEFTMVEARAVFEEIEGKRIDHANFKKFCLKTEEKRFDIEATGKAVKNDVGRPANTYRLTNKSLTE